MSRKGDSPLKRESTSIKIRPDIWKDAKIEAIKRDMDLSEFVEYSLAKEMVKEISTDKVMGGKLKGGKL